MLRLPRTSAPWYVAQSWPLLSNSSPNGLRNPHATTSYPEPSGLKRAIEPPHLGSPLITSPDVLAVPNGLYDPVVTLSFGSGVSGFSDSKFWPTRVMSLHGTS